MLITWHKVKFSLVTHDVDGFTDNDFEIAAKINALEHYFRPGKLHSGSRDHFEKVLLVDQVDDKPNGLGKCSSTVFGI